MYSKLSNIIVYNSKFAKNRIEKPKGHYLQDGNSQV